ncbi:hypothetical protein V8C37DRAFT_420290 [Trichoderma ceciliae]
MADASSTWRTRGFIPEQLTSSAPPSLSPNYFASAMFQDIPNEVPREYLMASPSSSSLFAGQGFPFPPQQHISDAPLHVTTSARLQEHYKQHFQEHHDDRASHVDKDLPSSSSTLPELGQDSSSARLVHEQRLSTCLNILRHVQRILRHRHHDAELQLTRTSRLVVQTTWDLFFQSPSDFMCHEMDVLTDATTTAILSEGGGLPRGHSVGDSEAWMRRLDVLRDLRDDEYDAKERVKKAVKQMQCAAAIMMAGLKEQAAVLERDSPTVDRYRGVSGHGHHEAETMASSPDRWVDTCMEGINTNKPSKSTTSATSSTFLNWPQPATPLNDEDASIDADKSSSDASRDEGQCYQECCRHRAPVI